MYRPKECNDKEQQIPLMGEIYASSETVYISLGKGSAAIERAMSNLSDGGLEPFSSTNSAINEQISAPTRL